VSDPSALFEADDLSSRVAVLQLLLGMLPAVDTLLAEVQAALGQRN
jgi:hypothetical protein